MIKLGCCLPGGSFMPEGVAEVPQSVVEQIITNCRYIRQCGFDYVEIAGGMLRNLCEEELKALEKADAEESLGLLAANSLFTGDLMMGNPESDRDAQVAYIQTLVDALARLGIRYAVFGSGAARRIPEGVSREEGLKVLYRFMNDFADYAEPRGITMLIEPLHRGETNVFVTVPESAEIVRDINRDGLRLLCDSFHMAMESTPFDAVKNAGALIKHCHIAEAPDRTCPGTFTTGDPAYNREFAKSLYRIGYTGGVTVECGFNDFEKDVPASLAYLKEIFTEEV